MTDELCIAIADQLGDSYPMLSRNPEHDAAAPEMQDVALVQGMADRDEYALAVLYKRHGAVLYSLALRMLGDRMESEEVLQDTFVRAWRHAGKFDSSRASVFTWLVMIARRQCLDRLRARRNNPLRNTDAGSDDRVHQSSDGQAETFRELTELGESIAVKLGVLPENQRACIELAFFQGLTQFEIAEKLGEPLGTVKARIRRGLLKLRNLVMPHA